MSNVNSPGGRVLIVEDEPLVALTIAEQLTDLGYLVVGPASTLEEACRLAASVSIDAALLDLKLRGRLTGAVADILTQRKIPFLVVTGYDKPPDGTFVGARVLNKPFDGIDLQRAVESTLASTIAPVEASRVQ